MFHLLKLLNLNQGLYRDDALIVCSLRPRQTELKKKEICRIFKEKKLSVTIQANLKVANFLNVTLDLNSELYKPFMKSINAISYINKDSNHPPSIVRNIPAVVNMRLCSILSNEAVFNAAAPPYQEALAARGFAHTLRLEPPTNPSNSKRNRFRKGVYFNPPNSSNVDTTIGAKFLHLMDSLGWLIPPLLSLFYFAPFSLGDLKVREGRNNFCFCQTIFVDPPQTYVVGTLNLYLKAPCTMEKESSPGGGGSTPPPGHFMHV
jgi:hypothetical protein